ncbi:MAG: sigma-54-dependent Fis family transcriptional regulator [Proteobacteria bacterium]|nr:sigma-54-dependent Fis family transcriptional regulator [Pseudomonadota bacterium]
MTGLRMPLDAKMHDAMPCDTAPPAGSRLSRPYAAPGSFGHMLGRSPSMQELYRTTERVAQTDATVLITGESGSGKELVARTIHERSARACGPFIAINCGAIPPNLIEAELFGHERGAFTGADRQRRGCFERAAGGTLFLDEITEMSPDLQVRLLRVLETGRFARVGGEHEIVADVRVLAATNRDPGAAVRAGALREDLMYRLAVLPVAVPPLRERGDDVVLLARAFLDAHNAAAGTRKRFTSSALEALAHHAWPGNVRELKNAVHRAFILAGDDVSLDASQPAAAERPGSGYLPMRVGMSIEAMERIAIVATLEHCRGNKRRAAEILGISLKTLYNRLSAWRSEAAARATHVATVQDHARAASH